MSTKKQIWKKIRRDYETTDTSFAKLSKQYPFSKNWIASVSKKEGWIAFRKMIVEIDNKAKDQFILESSISVQELMKIEDETLEMLQEVVEGKVPYEQIFKSLEDLNGNLTVKIDGTVKGVTETAMLIGNKRRELRGVLPLKERELVAMKREELVHKKQLDLDKLELDRDKHELIKREKDLDIREKEINVKLKELEHGSYLKEK